MGRIFSVLVVSLFLSASSVGSTESFDKVCGALGLDSASYTVKVILRTLREDDCRAAANTIMNFKQVSLAREQLTDISVLEGWDWIEGLELTSNVLTDVSVLRTFQRLKKVYLAHNQISDISFLQSLKDVEILKLGDNQIEDLSALKGMQNLRELDLYGNTKIRELSPIKHLPISVLSLKDVPVGKSVDELFPLPKLEIASMENTGLSDLSAFKSVSKTLKKMYLGGNRISELSPLMEFHSLVALSIFNNPISDLSPLMRLKGLVGLDISKTGIREFESVIRHMKLEQFYGVGLEISNLNWTKHLSPAANTLVLNNNNISVLSPLYSFKNLSNLQLSGNPIRTIDTEWLYSLPNLRVLEIDLENIESSEERQELRKIMMITFERNRRLSNSGKK